MGTKQNNYKANNLSENDKKLTIDELIQCSICKINIENKIGNGFICFINNYGKLIPVLITQESFLNKSHLIAGNKIKLEFPEKSTIINIDNKRRIYKDNKYNISIIELYNNELIQNYYLEIYYKQNYKTNIFENKNVKIIFFQKEKTNSLTDKIIKVEDNTFYLSDNKKNFPISLILDLETNKIIGYYPYNDMNYGIFIKQLIDEFIRSSKTTEIFLEVLVRKKDINQKIYFLFDQTSLVKNNRYILYLEQTHNHLINKISKEINRNTIAYINGKKSMSSNYFIPKKIGRYPIRIVVRRKMQYCCFMFACCKNIISINFSNFDTSNVVNMTGMFYDCISLNYLSDISCWNTSNVTDMSFMFYACRSFSTLPDISHWNTSNVEGIGYLFAVCRSLLVIPDISKWDTSKVKTMNYMFFLCTSLSSLPDISKWNISNLQSIKGMFELCYCLTKCPDISKWINSKNINKDYLFHDCYSLSLLPNIYKSNKIINCKEINCFSLILPN